MPSNVEHEAEALSSQCNTDNCTLNRDDVSLHTVPKENEGFTTGFAQHPSSALSRNPTILFSSVELERLLMVTSRKMNECCAEALEPSSKSTPSDARLVALAQVCRFLRHPTFTDMVLSRAIQGFCVGVGFDTRVESQLTFLECRAVRANSAPVGYSPRTSCKSLIK